MANTLQSVKAVCNNRYGFHADPRYSTGDNIEHLAVTTHPNDFPQRPRNLKVHNLCEHKDSVSQGLLDTLGLDLGYNVALPRPDANPIDFDRLRRSIRIQCYNFPESEEEYNPKLYKKSDWEPKNAPEAVEDAINAFELNTNKDYQESRKATLIYNVNGNNIEMLRTVKRERRLFVTATDKGLGTAVMEFELYNRRAFEDHLDNPTNYEEVLEDKARKINETNYRWICERFIDYPSPGDVSPDERTFFLRSLCGKRDPVDRAMELKEDLQLPYFYILPKVHKTPWATRPVVSGVSSVLEPLSKWVDIQLQRVVHLCPAYLKDSWHFLNEIKDLTELSDHCIVTSDAKAMYSNINTVHAISTIKRWFNLHRVDLPTNFPEQLILDSLERLMKFNVFTFGSRFFRQINGTAMGTNAACMYATIYYSYHEETVIMKHPSIVFYRRLIDDAFIIMKNNHTAFTEIQEQMDNFGPIGKRLEWEATEPTNSIPFLDLQVSITATGTIATSTYQKARNNYLYRPPSSAQPPHILYSLIYGTMHRYFWQNTKIQDYEAFVTKFFDRLTDRAHKQRDLEPLFRRAAKELKNSSMPNPRPGPRPAQSKDTEQMLFIHLPYHPQQPSRTSLRDHGKTLLASLTEQSCQFDRLVLAFSRAPNIGDLCKRNRLEATVDTSYPPK